MRDEEGEKSGWDPVSESEKREKEEAKDEDTPPLPLKQELPDTVLDMID